MRVSRLCILRRFRHRRHVGTPSGPVAAQEFGCVARAVCKLSRFLFLEQQTPLRRSSISRCSNLAVTSFALLMELAPTRVSIYGDLHFAHSCSGIARLALTLYVTIYLWRGKSAYRLQVESGCLQPEAAFRASLVFWSGKQNRGSSATTFLKLFTLLDHLTFGSLVH